MANRKQIQETLERAKQLLSEAEKASNDFSDIKTEIESYKNELFVDSESQQSVKTKVVELQDKLEKLHASSENKVQEIGEKLKEVSDLHSDLITGSTDENGKETKSIEKQIEEAKENIEVIYDDVSNKKDGITSFYNHIYGEKNEEGERSGGFKNYLQKLKTDIDHQKKDVDSLLRDATVTKLGEGYVASKYEYSVPKEKKFSEKKSLKTIPRDIYVAFYNIFGRKVGLLINHLIFIAPLTFIVYLFIDGGAIAKLLQEVNSSASSKELLYIKTAISIPLVWIALYGHKNIMQRKRLSEEYNHKLRFVQIYTMFMTRSDYPLDKKEDLQDELIKVVKRNPAEVYGRDETILDKITELVLAIRGKQVVDKKQHDMPEEESK